MKNPQVKTLEGRLIVNKLYSMTTSTPSRKTKFKADPESAQEKREEAFDKLEQGEAA